MGNEIQQYKLRELLYDIQRRPGIICAANSDKRLDYLFYFLFGWLIHNKDEISDRYHKEISHWIYKWIIERKCSNDSELNFTFLWYKMIYNVTDTEEEAWDLFFKLSYEYLDNLETENN